MCGLPVSPLMDRTQQGGMTRSQVPHPTSMHMLNAGSRPCLLYCLLQVFVLQVEGISDVVMDLQQPMRQAVSI